MRLAKKINSVMNFSLRAVDRVLFEGEIISVTAPGTSGELTILANHSPLITTLKKGIVKVRAEKGGNLQEFEISGGLLETSGNCTTILV